MKLHSTIGHGGYYDASRDLIDMVYNPNQRWAYYRFTATMYTWSTRLVIM